MRCRCPDLITSWPAALPLPYRGQLQRPGRLPKCAHHGVYTSCLQGTSQFNCVAIRKGKQTVAKSFHLRRTSQLFKPAAQEACASVHCRPLYTSTFVLASQAGCRDVARTHTRACASKLAGWQARVAPQPCRRTGAAALGTTACIVEHASVASYMDTRPTKLQLGTGTKTSADPTTPQHHNSIIRAPSLLHSSKPVEGCAGQAQRSTAGWLGHPTQAFPWPGKGDGAGAKVVVPPFTPAMLTISTAAAAWLQARSTCACTHAYKLRGAWCAVRGSACCTLSCWAVS